MSAQQLTVGAVRSVRSGLGTHRVAMVAGVVLGAVVVVVALAPVLAPYDPNSQNLGSILQPPSLGHLMGTDVLGRDVFSRVLWGGGPPVLVGVAAALLATGLGSCLGLLAGYRGGWLDALAGRAADIQLSIPGLALALLVLALLGTNLTNVVLIIAIESWPLHFRVVRTYVQSVRRNGYIESATLSGLGVGAVLLRHVVPGILPLLSVTATANLVAAVLAEASLSFLGMGVQPPRADWGAMVSDGQSQLGAAWWISVCPGLALMVLLLCVQIIGDRLAAKYSLEGL